jgi:hypothetical protein
MVRSESHSNVTINAGGLLPDVAHSGVSIV